MTEVEVRGSTPFGAFSRRYELFLIIRMFFNFGTSKNGKNPMAVGLHFFARQGVSRGRGVESVFYQFRDI